MNTGYIRKFAALVLAAASLTLGGCSGGATIEGLLTPPKLSAEQNDIYQALMNVMGKDISLKYPKSGEYRSAFVVTNVDTEDTDEAMVFYNAKSASGESSLRINFLDQQDGRWISVYDIAALGTEVERVRLENLGDGETSIIITYSALNSTSKAVSVLKFTDGTPVEMYRGSYAYLDFTDVNNNGGKEMTVISYDSAAELSTATMLGWQDGSFVTLSSTSLSVGAVEFNRVSFGGMEKSDDKALYIDYYVGDSVYGTEILLVRGTNLSLVNPIASLRRRSNSYTPAVYCSDIDGDGVIEVPLTSTLRCYEELTKPEQLFHFSWYGVYNTGVITRKSNMFISPKNDFYLDIPSRWDGLITVTFAADGEVIFWRAENSLSEVRVKLLSVKTVAASAAAPDGYELFASKEMISYYVKKGTNDSLLLTDAELADCLHLTETTG